MKGGNVMSEYFIQEQQLVNLTRTVVKDINGKSIFLLIGHWGTKGDVLSLYQMNGELVASIRQVSFIFGTRFDLYKEFKKVGVLRKLLSIYADFYYIEQLHWTVIGDIKNHCYTIYHMNHQIMKMDRVILFSGDYFHLDIKQDENAPLCICIAVILDYWLYNKKKQPNPSSIGWEVT